MRGFRIAAVLGMIAVLGAGVALAGDNLLENPSFEQGKVGEAPPDWSSHAYDGKDSNLKAPVLTVEGGRDGSKCCAVEVPEGWRWNLIEQYVRVKADPAKGLLLSAWVRTDDPEGHVCLVLIGHLPAKGNRQVMNTRLSFPNTGSEWTYCECAVPLKEADIEAGDEVMVRAIVQAYKPYRKVYVDDTRLAVVSADQAEKAFLNVIPEKYREGLVDTGHEASPIVLKDGSVALYLSKGGGALCRLSSDDGRTWGDVVFCKHADGKPVKAIDCMPVRLKSGKLGLLQHPGGYRLAFSVSEDEGKTWGEPVAVNPDGPSGKPLNGSPFVTRTGRIVVTAWNVPPGQKTLVKAWGGQPISCDTIVWTSDDEGKTWQQADPIGTLHDGKRYPFEEATGVELKDGRLMLFGRTVHGRLFKSYSSDGGLTWTEPVPTPLVSSYAPASLSRMPNGDLLCIWNQSSVDEVKNRMRRQRLTCAVSSDEGETWKHYRNLESLDDVVKVEQDVNWDVLDMPQEPPYVQPTDKTKYPYAPGPLRCAYPAVAFTNDRAVIAYDYGTAIGVFPGGYLRVRSLPYEWFYEKP